MDIFSNLFNHIKKNEVDGFNAESIFSTYLENENIEIKELNSVKFNRIRSNGSELKDFNLAYLYLKEF